MVVLPGASHRWSQRKSIDIGSRPEAELCGPLATTVGDKHVVAAIGAPMRDNGFMRPRRPTVRPALSTSPFHREDPAPAPVFSVDDRVTHDRRGLGRVVRVHGHEMDVQFGDQTVRVAMDSNKIHLL